MVMNDEANFIHFSIYTVETSKDNLLETAQYLIYIR